VLVKKEFLNSKISGGKRGPRSRRSRLRRAWCCFLKETTKRKKKTEKN
jgi:hypothetical protein